MLYLMGSSVPQKLLQSDLRAIRHPMSGEFFGNNYCIVIINYVIM